MTDRITSGLSPFTDAAAAEVNAKVGANRASAVMPGGIMTPLQRHLPREEMIAMGWMNEEGVVAQGFKTPAQGASTSVWAAVGPELESVGGLYLEDLGQAVTFSLEARAGVMDYALDPEAAERLWALSEETTGLRVG